MCYIERIGRDLMRSLFLLLLLLVSCGQETNTVVVQEEVECKLFWSTWERGGIEINVAELDLDTPTIRQYILNGDTPCWYRFTFLPGSNEVEGTLQIELPTGGAGLCQELVGTFDYTKNCQTMDICEDGVCEQYR